jgi:methionyl-tRNA formyltransferase
MSISKENLRIVFFGTPDFAVESLKNIINNGYQVVAVVTAPDKPAGRGQQMNQSAVKKAALQLNLPVLQPEKLKSPEFIETLKAYKADLQIVIAFRMLPEMVWNMPSLGTFNLHASFLPYYRGAAPINRAIMNGETETGVSTFFLKHEIDTGDIILQEKTKIEASDTAGTLHDKLMVQGAELVVKSLDKICRGSIQYITQSPGDYPTAPKIFTQDCELDFSQTAKKLHNTIRGLSPYPCAFAIFHSRKLKIFESELTDEPSLKPGKMEIRGKGELVIHASDKILRIKDVQYEGKKRMLVRDFLNGFKPI